MTHQPPTPIRALDTTPSFTDAAAGWSRGRLLGLLLIVVLTALLVLAGLGYAAWFALNPRDASAPRPATTGAGHGVPARPGGIPDTRAGTAKERRDAIAAAPMLTVDASDAAPAPPSTRTVGSLTIPAATTGGPALVPTGFPHTPAGALGQLAAIETTVLQAMSIPVAHDVYDAWALPGGVGAQDWILTGNVQAFLGAAGMGPEKDPGTIVLATPAAAQVKGTDGPDWVLACVLLQVRAVIATDARIGYGHCERMQWHPDPSVAGVGGRWMIAPGTPPAVAPSTWPGTDRAIAAGWRPWREDQAVAAVVAGRD